MSHENLFDAGAPSSSLREEADGVQGLVKTLVVYTVHNLHGAESFSVEIESRNTSVAIWCSTTALIAVHKFRDFQKTAKQCRNISTIPLTSRRPLTHHTLLQVSPNLCSNMPDLN